jgi:hypothetical protein
MLIQKYTPGGYQDAEEEDTGAHFSYVRISDNDTHKWAQVKLHYMHDRPIK